MKSPKKEKLAENYIAKYVIRLHCISLYLISWSDKTTFFLIRKSKFQSELKSYLARKYGTQS
jgi:hypothetical protein